MSIFHKIFYSCRRTDELVSRSMDEPLSWLDRLRMGVHLRVCGPCQEVQHQVETLHDLSADFGGGLDATDEEEVPFTMPSEPPRR